MSEIMGLCSYRCDLCSAYNDNINNNDNRQEISRGWKRYFGFEIPPEEIGCVGCIGEGKHADADCPVRPCALEKKVENCAQCDDFICEKLRGRVEFAEKLLEKRTNNAPGRDYRSVSYTHLRAHETESVRANQKRNRYKMVAVPIFIFETSRVLIS